jgi:hypothetical protein
MGRSDVRVAAPNEEEIMTTPQQFVEQVARLLKYGDEFEPADGPDAEDTLNALIDMARELTGIEPDLDDDEIQARPHKSGRYRTPVVTP